jgi:hypothetical protein
MRTALRVHGTSMGAETEVLSWTNDSVTLIWLVRRQLSFVYKTRLDGFGVGIWGHLSWSLIG